MANNSNRVSQLESFQKVVDSSNRDNKVTQLQALADKSFENNQTTVQFRKAQEEIPEEIPEEIEEEYEDDFEEEIGAELPTSFAPSSTESFKKSMNSLDDNWIIVKDHFKKSGNSQEPLPRIFSPEERENQMNSLLSYRRHVTVNKSNDQSAMSKAKSKLLAEDPKRGDESDQDYLEWNSAGSDDFTSDIDLNIMGRKSELASQYAFSFFREEWVKESGEVFDVNFYARDWKPKNLMTGLKNANENIDPANKNIDRDDLEGADFEGKGNENEAKRIEKINSIAKLIRDMHDLPEDLQNRVKLALDGDAGGAAQAAWSGGVQAVENWDTVVGESGSEGDSRAKKENLAYASATSELAECRTALESATADNKEELEGQLLAARLKAAFYGPEAYVTEAAFIHGVINKQIQSTTFKSREKKKNKVNVKLDQDELLQVVIQNVGFAFHHINELDLEDSGAKNMGYAAVAKYIYRACNAIKHMGEESFMELSVKAKNTVLEKKNQEQRTKEIGDVEVTGVLSELDSNEIKNYLVDLLAKANSKSKEGVYEYDFEEEEIPEEIDGE